MTVIPKTSRRFSTPPDRRFWARVEWSEGCWPWLGAQKGNGYGNIHWEGRYTSAHRVAYLLAVGPIPDGYQVDHLCRNRICVNPAHLEAVTPRTNTYRGLTLERIKRTHCPYGHEYTAANTRLSRRNQRHCRTCRRSTGVAA